MKRYEMTTADIAGKHVSDARWFRERILLALEKHEYSIWTIDKSAVFDFKTMNSSMEMAYVRSIRDLLTWLSERP